MIEIKLFPHRQKFYVSRINHTTVKISLYPVSEVFADKTSRESPYNRNKEFSTKNVKI